jgi:hypothetical protein
MTSRQVETARPPRAVLPVNIGEMICRLSIQEKPNLRETVMETKHLFY